MAQLIIILILIAILWMVLTFVAKVIVLFIFAIMICIQIYFFLKPNDFLKNYSPSYASGVNKDGKESLGSGLMLLSSLMAFISLTFLDFFKASAFGFSITKSAFEVGLYGLFSLWIYPAFCVTFNLRINLSWGLRLAMVNLIISEIILIYAFNYTYKSLHVNAIGLGSIIYFAASLIYPLAVAIYTAEFDNKKPQKLNAI